MNHLSKNVVFLIQFILMGLGIAFLWLLFTGKFSSEAVKDSNIAAPQNTHIVADVPDMRVHGHLSFSTAVEKAQPAVVNIYTNTVDEKIVRTPQGLVPLRRNRRGLGSGVIVDEEGYN